jgi:[acyl-carrier-protein] S-malonyltransferase
MTPAVAPFEAAVGAVAMVGPRPPFVSNRTADVMTDPGEIAGALVYQLTHPVRWVQCVQYLQRHGVTRAIEFGPGRVLGGLIKRIAPGIETSNVGGAPVANA